MFLVTSGNQRADTEIRHIVASEKPGQSLEYDALPVSSGTAQDDHVLYLGRAAVNEDAAYELLQHFLNLDVGQHHIKELLPFERILVGIEVEVNGGHLNESTVKVMLRARLDVIDTVAHHHYRIVGMQLLARHGAFADAEHALHTRIVTIRQLAPAHDVVHQIAEVVP